MNVVPVDASFVQVVVKCNFYIDYLLLLLNIVVLKAIANVWSKSDLANLIFYLSSKLSLEYSVHCQNSLIEWIREKQKATFIACKWFCKIYIQKPQQFSLNQDCFFLKLWKVWLATTTKHTRNHEKELRSKYT